jgi:hypothetical protein
LCIAGVEGINWRCWCNVEESWQHGKGPADTTALMSHDLNSRTYGKSRYMHRLNGVRWSLLRVFNISSLQHRFFAVFMPHSSWFFLKSHRRLRQCICDDSFRWHCNQNIRNAWRLKLVPVSIIVPSSGTRWCLTRRLNRSRHTRSYLNTILFLFSFAYNYNRNLNFIYIF